MHGRTHKEPSIKDRSLLHQGTAQWLVTVIT
jgi:hypothetical protein